jgi:aquaporin Z
MMDALRAHWPEYMMEAAELGIFMISAATFGVLLEYPGSPMHRAISDPFLRRIIMGCAMGVTSICIVYSPWGKQSGAHFNPSVTLTWFRLGKVRRLDAVFYIAAQFVGGTLGIIFARACLGDRLGHPAVNYVATLPGTPGTPVAFLAEFIIAFLMMSMVLRVTSRPSLARYTGLFAGAMVALYITFEAPISGMSMNPARTFGSAFSAMRWDAFWVYCIAPPLAMLAAADVYVRQQGVRAVACAKLHHENKTRCIHCGANMSGQPSAVSNQS